MRNRRGSNLFFGLIIAVASASVIGCGEDIINVEDLNPDKSYAEKLGVQGPITEEQARQIAEAATGGQARSVENDDEFNVPVYGVEVRVPDGQLDVKIRISDGAILRIERDDE